MIREEPITVRLHLSLSRYLDATGENVNCFCVSVNLFAVRAIFEKCNG